jgi:peptidyl-prolyl cis-trans isomerase C
MENASTTMDLTDRSPAVTLVGVTSEGEMPRWNVRPIPGLFCLLGLILGIAAWPAGRAWIADSAVERAGAAVLSTGAFSDQGDQGSSDLAGAKGPPPAAPLAGTPPPETHATYTAAPATDPMVANVEGHPIYLSELGDTVQMLPEQMRRLPFEVVYPMLLDRMIDREALVLLARHEKVDDDPKVKRQIDAATARVLESALLERVAGSQATEPEVRARYQRDYGSQPTVEEVHVRHILVGSEDEAKRLIAQLNQGADFATLARRFSKDPDGMRGGDLGFFRRDQVWQGFADLAFSLQPGQLAQTPIANEFGWHVVQTIERRRVPPPTLDQMRDTIRKQLLREAVQRLVVQARDGLNVTKFNMDGSAVNNASAAAALGILQPVNGGTPPTSEQPVGLTPPPAAAPTSPPATTRAPQKTGN